MGFPELPFRIDKHADADLVKYLQTPQNFPYLTSETQKQISGLEPKSLREQNSHLLKLWPEILADALRELKRNDPREWDKNNKQVNYDSFFHKDSLGVTELCKVLESFSNFESMLYGAAPDRYRDHIAHSFRVWIIGHGVLRNKSCFKSLLFSDELIDKRTKTKADSIQTDEWECMWAIVALCHDLGYPLSYVSKINNSARNALQQMGLVPGGDLRFSFSQQVLPFHDTLVRLMASRLTKREDRYSTHLQTKYYLKLLKSFDDLEHGIISSLLVSKALVYFLESDLCLDPQDTLNRKDAKQFIIRREILRAIAAHTCQDIYHLRFDTLSFLLYMVDELQCWGRPTLQELQYQPSDKPESQAEVILFEPMRVGVIIRSAAQQWDTDQLEITYKQLGRLRRMLRLGVDTSKLKNRYLEFGILPEKGTGLHLLLKNGHIKIEEVNEANLDCLKSQ